MRPVTVARWAVVALALTLLAPAAGATTAEQETQYLGTDGFPRASLLPNPMGGELTNFDRGRDVEPGLFLERSALGLQETDEARFQHWQADAGGRRIVGYPVLVIWAAPSRFDATVSADFEVFLLDCNRTGSECTSIDSGEATVPSGSADWSEISVVFDAFDHDFDEGRHLGVRVVVSESSESDLMLAYGFPAHRSRLTIYADPPVVESVASVPSITMSAQVNTELMRREGGNPEPVSMAAVPAESSWSWLATMVLSSLALAALGVLLVRTLTRPGRHEVRFVTSRAESRPREPVPIR